MTEQSKHPGYHFLPDKFWRCFQQGVNPEEQGAIRDDDDEGWWVPDEKLYRGKDYELPKDDITVGGLDGRVKRQKP